MVSSSKLKTRDKYLQKKYGITLAQYDDKLEQQKHRCGMCYRHKSNFKSSLHVDHNHKTGKVRGLLCYRCNKFVLGRNTVRTASQLLSYLIKHEVHGGKS